MKRILLASDGSEHSIRASETAGRLSAALGIPVDVVNVVSDTTPVTSGAIHEYADVEQVVINQRDLFEAIGADVVQAAADMVRKAGGEVGTTKVLIGSPAREIVDYAEERDADCIIMGRRGLGNMSGLFMGSISHKVGHLSGKTLITTE